MINFLLGFSLAALWCPAMPRSGHELRWVLLAIALPAMLVYGRRSIERFTWPMLFGAAFLAYAAASMAWAPNLPIAVGSLAHLAILFCAFHIGATAYPYERLQLYRGLILGLVPSAVLIPLQLAGYTGVEQWASPAGTWVNKLFVAELAMPLVILVLARGDKAWVPCWPWVLIVIPPAVLTASRGAWLAGAVAAGIYWAGKRPWKIAAVAFCFPLLAYLAALYSPATTTHRLDIWLYALDNLTLMGNGLGSYIGAYGAEHVHNDFLEVAYELGLPGTILILLCIAALPRHGAEYYAGAACLAIACFSFPFHNPATAFLAVYLAGELASHAVPVRNFNVVRRNAFGSRLARPARHYGLDHPTGRSA